MFDWKWNHQLLWWDSYQGAIKKMEQEENSLRNVDDSFKKIVVLGEPTPIYCNDAGITTMGIYDFLLNENSLEL